MGTEMTAFIEYDRSRHDYERYGSPHYSEPPPSPFSTEDPLALTPESVTAEGGIFTGSKNYVFFAAIAGIRSETEIEPLYPPRGLPQHRSYALQKHLREWGGEIGEIGQGWLTLCELEAALDHQRVNREHLSFETETILAIMRNLGQRLGPDRVRLLFGFSG